MNTVIAYLLIIHATSAANGSMPVLHQFADVQSCERVRAALLSPMDANKQRTSDCIPITIYAPSK